MSTAAERILEALAKATDSKSSTDTQDIALVEQALALYPEDTLVAHAKAMASEHHGSPLAYKLLPSRLFKTDSLREELPAPTEQAPDSEPLEAARLADEHSTLCPVLDDTLPALRALLGAGDWRRAMALNDTDVNPIQLRADVYDRFGEIMTPAQQDSRDDLPPPGTARTMAKILMHLPVSAEARSSFEAWQERSRSKWHGLVISLRPVSDGHERRLRQLLHVFRQALVMTFDILGDGRAVPSIEIGTVQKKRLQ